MEARDVRQRPRSGHQRGAAGLMVAMALVLLAMGGAAVHYAEQAQWTTIDTVSTQQLARRARDMVMAFAAQKGRFPCPAPVEGGAEDCSGQAAKGFLPVQTLWPADYSDISDSFRDVRYGVYRGTNGPQQDPRDPDLASLQEWFAPAGFPPPPDEVTYPQELHSGWDWCRKLGQIAAAGVNVDSRWRRAGADSNAWLAGNPSKADRLGYAPWSSVDAVRNVAFAVAVPQAGAPRSYSGVNSQGGSFFEDPDRPNSDEYRDSVEVVSFDAAYEGAGCGVGLMAMDTMQSERFRTDTLKSRVDGLMPYSEFYMRASALHVAGNVVSIATASTELVATAYNVATSFLSLGASNPQNLITMGILTVDVAVATAEIAIGLAHAGAYLAEAARLEGEIQPWYGIEPFVVAADRMGHAFEVR